MVGGQSEGFVIFHKPNTTIYIYIVYLYVAHDCEMGFGCDGYIEIKHILYQRISDRKTT